MDDIMIPLPHGGTMTVIRADRARHGWVYLNIEGTGEPDVDGVATMDDVACRALVAALGETP